MTWELQRPSDRFREVKRFAGELPAYELVEELSAAADDVRVTFEREGLVAFQWERPLCEHEGCSALANVELALAGARDQPRFACFAHVGAVAYLLAQEGVRMNGGQRSMYVNHVQVVFRWEQTPEPVPLAASPEVVVVDFTDAEPVPPLTVGQADSEAA